MGRAPCCDKNGLKKGPWTPEEDHKLIDYIQKHGHGSWRTLPKNAGLARCGKSCRLRWTNYLRPDIKRGRFSFEEEETIIQLHSILGNKWSAIAARLPGRTDNEIKNYWNTHIRKRLLSMGIDPVTHSPRLDLLDLSPLLAQPMYDLTQLDVTKLLGNEPLVNLELLRLATNLLSSQCQSSNFVPQSTQEQQFSIPHAHQESFPFLHAHHDLENPMQDVQACTTSNAQFPSESQLMHPTVAPMNPWEENQNFSFSFPEDFLRAQSFSCQLPLEQSIPNFDALNQETNNLISVLSTPASSPTHLNSSSTYRNSSTEDEKDTYCSNLFNFQIPDLVDMSDYM